MPGSFSPQIKPDFMNPAAASTGSRTAGSTQPGRSRTDAFGHMKPQDQRAALYDQARQQQRQQLQTRFHDSHSVNAALPGGLTQKQRMEFGMLRRTDPLAAQKQLDTYQMNADIRYNKPMPGAAVQPDSGLTYRRPPTNFNGPRRSF